MMMHFCSWKRDLSTLIVEDFHIARVTHWVFCEPEMEYCVALDNHWG